MQAIASSMHPGQRIFVGVTDPIEPRVETAEQVRDRVLLAARHIPLDVLGTTDDCGFSPFADDGSTTRETAFEKIRARVEGTALAEREAHGLIADGGSECDRRRTRLPARGGRGGLRVVGEAGQAAEPVHVSSPVPAPPRLCGHARVGDASMGPRPAGSSSPPSGSF